MLLGFVINFVDDKGHASNISVSFTPNPAKKGSLLTVKASLILGMFQCACRYTANYAGESVNFNFILR